jgi:hypothetical protein
MIKILSTSSLKISRSYPDSIERKMIRTCSVKVVSSNLRGMDGNLLQTTSATIAGYMNASGKVDLMSDIRYKITRKK